METLFNKEDGCKKWTIIAEYIDNDNKTAYVQNWGWDENQLIKEFKKTNTNGFEKDISENELKILLQTVITNYNIIGAYEISNHYNTDMKTINEIKSNRELLLQNKGFKIVNHCNVKIEYSDNCEQIYTTRGLLKLYSDQCKELESKITRQEEEYDSKEEYLNELKEKINKKEEEYNEQKNEFESLCTRYRNGKKELKKIQADIENIKENLPDEIKKLIKEKENLLLVNNELNDEIFSLKEKKNELNDEIFSLKEEDNKLRNKISQMNLSLNNMENDYFEETKKYNDLKNKYNELKDTYNELIETVSSIEGIL